MRNIPGHLSKPLKVFHLLSNPGIGGIEKMLSNLVPRFDKSLFDVQIVNLQTQSRCYELWDRCDVRYHCLPTPGTFLLGCVPRLARLFWKERPDIVEIYGSRAEIIGRLAAKIAGVPVVLTGTLDTHEWRKWYHVWLDRITRWTVAGWIPNSEACKRRLIEVEKHPAPKIKVIYDGIDISAWTRRDDSRIRQHLCEEFNCNEQAILCVTVANLRYQKGHPFLIEAVPRVLKVNPNMRFLLVGTDFLNGQLQRSCRDLGIEKAVIFAGYRGDIRDIYEAADVAVLPSLYEGLPISLIEAMSMELPVVSTTVSGIPELVVDDVTGLLVPPKDVDALTEALVKIGASPEKRRQMGQAGRQRVLEKFSIERMVKELANYYQLQFNSSKSCSKCCIIEEKL